ncbi:MAG: polyprenyl synthetase family protein [Pirellulales bacterium]
MTFSATGVDSALDLGQLRKRIDDALDQYARFDAGCPPHLVEAIRYSLLGPGKRLRPLLVLMAAQACGGTIDAALPAAGAVEMVHAYSLVHDDLPAMDDDDLRRGRPTCHKAFGEAVAILVGDALLARAFELLATELESPAVAAQCSAVLARAAGATALVGGQAADLQTAERRDDAAANLQQLESIHRRKTGALFVASLELGGIVAQAAPEQLAALAAYGRNLGLAFQITDDLLDVAGSQTAVGKRLAKDARNGKLTFPGLTGVEESRRRAEKLVEDACAMIEVLGPKAEPLCALARFVSSRNR